MEQAVLYLSLAAAFGLFMAWGIGANDVANAMGTSVGSRALTLRQAIVVAAIFEFAGAVLAGGQVTQTIRKGIIDASSLSASPEILIYGMLAALLAAGIWLLVASYFGWPVSTTHSIVGAIVGFAVVGIGLTAVNWGKIGAIVASWVVSPLLAGAIAFVLFLSIQRLIFNAEDPFRNARRYVPFYIFLVGFVIALVTLLKGLSHIGLKVTTGQSYAIALVAGLVLMAIGWWRIRAISREPRIVAGFHFANVERVFGVLMVITACAMAFAHGSNDVANAIGPVAAIVGIVNSGGNVAQESPLPLWVLTVGAVGIVAGLVTYGHKVMATVGTRITDLTPSRGFAATLAAAATVVVASGTGLPISTTHTLVGAVLGVGMARGIAAINLRVVQAIFVSWIVTLPAGALLAIIFYYLLKAMFGGG
ncbi:MAG: inorganic phosphate transporter [Gammaproteobacteria bacterium]|nr:inorganic phosphate transporter [Gammaproteobacteria bacterium]MDH3411957.1 inorganic phosphate transporter [Gammaproteobacteria bacterium]